MSQTIPYPEIPEKKGALPRKVLVDKAVEKRYCFDGDNIDSFDLISAAVVLGSKETVELCLDLGARVVRNDASILNLIIEETYDNPGAQKTMEMLELVLGHEKLDRETIQEASLWCMEKALRNNNIEVFDLLVEKGPDPLEARMGIQDSTLLHFICVDEGMEKAVDVILSRWPDLMETESSMGETPLLVAAKSGSIGMVLKLLDEGADPFHVNEEGQGLLHLMGWEVIEDVDTVVAELKSRLGRQKWERLIRQEAQGVGLPIQAMARRDIGANYIDLAPDGDVDATASLSGKQVQGGEIAAEETSALGLALMEGNYKAVRALRKGGADWRKMTRRGHTCWHVWAEMTNVLHAYEESETWKPHHLMKVKRWDVKKSRRLLLKTGVGTEELSDDGQHPIMYTDHPQAKAFFAQQRKRALLRIPGKRGPDRPMKM